MRERERDPASKSWKIYKLIKPAVRPIIFWPIVDELITELQTDSKDHFAEKVCTLFYQSFKGNKDEQIRVRHQPFSLKHFCVVFLI